MCVNDIICTVCQTHCFSLIILHRKTDPVVERNNKGIPRRCDQSETSLIAGETAEMPGVLGTDFDLAGFAVGDVEKNTELMAPNC